MLPLPLFKTNMKFLESIVYDEITQYYSSMPSLGLFTTGQNIREDLSQLNRKKAAMLKTYFACECSSVEDVNKLLLFNKAI